MGSIMPRKGDTGMATISYTPALQQQCCVEGGSAKERWPEPCLRACASHALSSCTSGAVPLSLPVCQRKAATGCAFFWRTCDVPKPISSVDIRVGRPCYFCAALHTLRHMTRPQERACAR
jgi:hypothetical protein